MSSVPTPPPPSDVEHACTAVEADLGWGLGVVFRTYIKIANIVMAEVPGGPRGYQVLAAAERGMKSTQLALAQHLGIDRTVMTYLLDDLERAGLIQRQPDPADRRARRVVATAEGRDFVARLQQRLGHAEDYVLGALDDRDRETFRTLLRRVAVHAEELDPAGDPCHVVEEIEEADVPAPRRGRRR